MEAAIANQNDEELVDRLIQRDGDAWREFVGQYLGLIKRRISATANECRFVLEPVEVEDIAADVFQSLLKNQMASLRNFQFVSSLSTWLSVIARRACLGFLSKRPRDRGQGIQYSNEETSLLDLQAETVASSEPDLKLIQKEEYAKIQECLAELRPGDRRLLKLYYAHELNYKQISQEMGISVNSVGPKIQRAQNRLRKMVRCDVEKI